MFDRLDDLLIRYEEVMGELQEPGAADDQQRFRKLMKEQSDLAPIVEAYNEYKKEYLRHRAKYRAAVNKRYSRIEKVQNPQKQDHRAEYQYRSRSADYSQPLLLFLLFPVYMISGAHPYSGQPRNLAAYIRNRQLCLSLQCP